MAHYDTIYEYAPALAGGGLAIGIVMSRFNPDIGEGLLAPASPRLKRASAVPTATSRLPAFPAHSKSRWCCRRWRRATATMA